VNELRCPSYSELSAYLADDLGPDRAAWVEAHVGGCPVCRQALADLDAAGGAGVRLPAPAAGPAPGPGSAVLRKAAALVPGGTVLGEVGTYELGEPLGAGGMGCVRRARHGPLGRDVAIKFIHDKFLHSPEMRQRFVREIRALGSLEHHPNLVYATDAGVDDKGRPFLVMEYVEGKNLKEVLEERGRLPWREACGYVLQAARGLQHAHRKGLVHRDLKPGNLLLAKDGVVKVLDMGLARSLLGDPAEEHLTGAGRCFGTPGYMAPEQARDAAAADIRADIYSLGCTLYALLTGRVPSGPGAAEALRDGEPAVPARLVDVLKRMLAADPAGRHADPRELIRDLERLLAPESVLPPAASAALVAAILLAVASWFLWGQAGKPSEEEGQPAADGTPPRAREQREGTGPGGEPAEAGGAKPAAAVPQDTQPGAGKPAPSGDEFDVTASYDLESGRLGDIGDIAVAHLEGGVRFTYQTAGRGPHHWDHRFVRGEVNPEPARFAGIMALSPANEWGTRGDCGFDLRPFRGGVLRWEARAPQGVVHAQFTVGGVNWVWDEKRMAKETPPFPDTMPQTPLGGPKRLTQDWQPFQHPLPDSEPLFLRVVGGFGWTLSWDNNGVERADERPGPKQVKVLQIEVRRVRYEKK
jgi:hypothetical protein